MAYPAEIVTRDVTVGSSFAIESGDALTVRAKVTASRGMIWTATGYRFPSVPDTKTGSEVTFTLPVTDQAGWRDMSTPGSLIDVSAPDSYTHRYTVILETLGDGGTVLARASIGPFVLPTGDLSPIDLDLLVSSGTVAGDVVLSGDFATVAQGELAETAVQPGDLARVATTGAYVDLTGKPTIPAAGVTDHGELTGLSDDDHAQYALADGSRGAFAATSHTHTIPDVTGLQAALDAAGASVAAAEAAVQSVADMLTGEDAAVASLIADPASSTRAALDDQRRRGVQRLIGALDQERGSAVVAVMGASNSDESPEWPTRAVDMIAAARPGLTFTRYGWADATSAPWSDPASGDYAAPVVRQTGTAVESRGRVWLDTFTRSGELSWSASTPGQAAVTWSGVTGLWSCDGSAAVAAAAGNGVSARLAGADGADKIAVGGTLYMDQATAAKRVAFSVGGTNKVTLYIRNTTGTWEWWLWKTVGTASQVLATATIAVSTDTVDWSLAVDSSGDITMTAEDQTRTATIPAGEAADVTAGSVYLSVVSTGAVASGTPVSMSLLWADAYRTRVNPTLDLYIGSKAGSTLSYQRDRLSRILPVEPDVVILASMANYASTVTVDEYLADLDLTVAEVRALWPDADFAVTSYSPLVPPQSLESIERQNDRCVAVRRWAAHRGHGYIPAYEAFMADGPQPDRIRADGVHVTALSSYDAVADEDSGAYLWATAVVQWLAEEGLAA